MDAILQALKFVFILLEVLILFNLLILVHELGHFLAARWRGMVVEKFGIWFGKPIWEREYRGVKYSLGTIPAGGFVMLPQMAPMEMLEGDSEYSRANLPQAPVKDRIIVAAAGPLASLGLAVACAVVIWMVGKPVGEADTSTTIGYVMEESPAEQAGLQVGDEVMAVGGKKVDRFGGMGNSIQWHISTSGRKEIPMQIRRGGETLIVTVAPETPETKGYQRDKLPQIGIEPKRTPIVAQVYPNSPAEKAGLQANDVFVALNGEPLYHPGTVNDYIGEHGTDPFTLTIERDGERFDRTVTPEVPVEPADAESPMLGVLWDTAGKWQIEHPGPIKQVTDSVNMLVGTLAALVSPASPVKAEHLSGPVGIMRIYYLLFQSEHGWRLAIWFSVILNVNLAILNLLPFPVLDGGHIVMATAEGIRRKPVNARVLQFIQGTCALALVGFLLYVTFFDVQDLGPGGGGGGPTEIKFAPND